MSTAKELHDQAMDLVETAILERVRGNAELTAQLYSEALELELAAIEILDAHGKTAEPTWSVLHRGAGWMAFNSNQFRRAEQLASKALAGDPHPEIADELRDLWEQSNSHRHLELRGVELAADEMQLSLSGDDVGHGFITATEFITRTENVLKLVNRTIERLNNRPFRRRGPMPKYLADSYGLFISTPRAASFAATMKLSSPIAEQSSHNAIGAYEIFDEFMDLMDMINHSRVDEIRERIPNSQYLHNFLDLSKKIAPDGDRIRQVGFTTVRSGHQRSVPLTRPAAEINLQPYVIRAPYQDVPYVSDILAELLLTGVLLGAEVRRSNTDYIKVVDDDGQMHEIHVTKGKLDEIVQPLWHSRVVVLCARQGSRWILQEIEPVGG